MKGLNKRSNLKKNMITIQPTLVHYTSVTNKYTLHKSTLFTFIPISPLQSCSRPPCQTWTTSKPKWMVCTSKFAWDTVVYSIVYSSVSQILRGRGAPTNKIEEMLPYFEELSNLQPWILFFEEHLMTSKGVLVAPGAGVGNHWCTHSIKTLIMPPFQELLYFYCVHLGLLG